MVAESDFADSGWMALSDPLNQIVQLNTQIILAFIARSYEGSGGTYVSEKIPRVIIELILFLRSTIFHFKP